MHIAISYNRIEKSHYILRVVPRNELRWEPETSCLGFLDGLLTAKTPSQLLHDIDAMPSLFPGGRFGDNEYWCELEDAPKNLENFVSCDAVQLEAELQIVSAGELRANNARLARFMAEYGVDGRHYADSLKYLSCDECVLLIEPLQDWMTLQSSLSLCARLRGQLEEDAGQVSLEKAGFAYRANTRLKDDFYIIPFKFNTYYSSGNIKPEHDPLFSAIAPWGKLRQELFPGAKEDVRYLGEETGKLFFATYPVAMQSYPTRVDEIFIARRRSASQKTYYLMARGDDGEGAIARSVVSSFTRAFRTLKDPGGKRVGSQRRLGWEYDPDGEFAGRAAPRLVPQSLISALWYQLTYHPGMRTMICKYCGNAALAREQGNQKHYCSASCRVMGANRAKASGKVGEA